MTGAQKGGVLEDLAATDRATTGALIKRSRQKRKLSARALSAMAELSPSYVSKVESGEIEPSLKAFARIAVALQLTQQEIWLCVIASR